MTSPTQPEPLSAMELERLRKSSWPDYPFPARILATVDAQAACISELEKWVTDLIRALPNEDL